jgi:hypothetical protein
MDATAGAADAALGVAERDLTSAKALDNSVFYEIPQGWNAAEIRFLMTTNGANAVMDVWAGRLKPHPAGGISELARVCTLDVECGLQQSDTGSLLYADEITVTNEQWLKALGVIQSGNDTDLMARLIIDLCGYDVLLFHGHTTFAEDCQVEIAGF